METLGSNRTPEISGIDIFLALFRIAITVIVGVFQIAPEVPEAWGAIWEDKAWRFTDIVEQLGIPQAKWIGVSILVTIALAVTGLGLGFLTRLSSLILTLYSTFFIGYVATQKAEVSQLELAIVYGAVFVFLVLRGPGHLSADYFFRRPKQVSKSFRDR